MGNLLVLLKQDAVVNSEIFLDFENAKPTEPEKDVHEFVLQQMKPSEGLITSLKSYTGCGEQIRKAISSPGKQTEEEAWNAVCPAVGQLKEYFDFSSVLVECFSRLLRQLCTLREGETVRGNMEKYQATALQLAQILTFALDFDDLKMTNPSIQNDFSYYRRTLSRLKMSPENQALLDNALVKDELANRMSLFYAYPTPMLKCLVDGLGNLTAATTENHLAADNVTICLSLMVGITHMAVTQNKFARNETMFFCLRVMVACIISYDHVHQKGAFHKDSEVNVKSHIKLIQTNGGSHTDGLLNALRYTTKHLNDESTPKAVKAMLV